MQSRECDVMRTVGVKTMIVRVQTKGHVAPARADRGRVARFLRDEAGGATVEYVVMTGLTVAVSIALLIAVVGGTSQAATAIAEDINVGRADIAAADGAPRAPRPRQDDGGWLPDPGHGGGGNGSNAPTGGSDGGSGNTNGGDAAGGAPSTPAGDGGAGGGAGGGSGSSGGGSVTVSTAPDGAGSGSAPDAASGGGSSSGGGSQKPDSGSGDDDKGGNGGKDRDDDKGEDVASACGLGKGNASAQGNANASGRAKSTPASNC
jgi:Flp pilus assembly pilin Flp